MTNLKKHIYLASSSRARRELLASMDIPFTVIEQQATEKVRTAGRTFSEQVLAIAEQKMAHVVIPAVAEVQEIMAYVLVADTLGCDLNGNVHGKPKDREDAREKIKALRQGGVVGTAFCLAKKVWQDNAWHGIDEISQYVETKYTMDLPDDWIESYLDHTPDYLNISGAITIEGYGAQFVKTIDGSYSSVLGLPLAEVREALNELGYFDRTR